LKKELLGVIVGGLFAILVVEMGFSVTEPPLMMASKELALPGHTGISTERVIARSAVPYLQLVILPSAFIIGLAVYVMSRKKIG